MSVVGCVPTYSVRNNTSEDYSEIKPPAGSSRLDPVEVQEIIARTDERNKTVEDDPNWIKRAYNGLMVRKLNNLSEKEYKGYRKYLDDGDAYVIVHPAFFPFFHYPKTVPVIDQESFLPKNNVVERLLHMKPRDVKFALIQAQERRMRDFLEFMSTREKLVIVIVPRNYNKYRGYKYKEGYDEYTRYLNEVTNFSKSVLFAESRSPNRGYLTEEDGIRLMEFLLSVNAETIYIGGGYIGRCLEDFYVLLTEEFGREDIYVVPELSDISPREISKKMAKTLLTPEGEINIEMATQNLSKDTYRIQEVIPKVKNLTIIPQTTSK
jgi:hypothetical protein